MGNENTNPVKDLGYMNGWTQGTPEIVRKCVDELKHEVEYRQVGNCLHQYTCRLCGYTYRVDSSG